MTRPDFDNRTALVTGAGSGIGRATALMLAGRGAKVVVADIDETGVAATVRQIAEQGGVAVAQPLDVTSEPAWDVAVDAVGRSAGGRLDVLVNCAGIAMVQGVADTSLDDWRRVMSVNLDGVFLGTRAGVRAMRRDGRGGSIVNVSSASGLKAAPASSAYCASKAAVIMFSKSAAIECVQAGDGIRINVVAPGGVKTPVWEKTPGASAATESDIWNAPSDAPIGKRFAAPDEVAAVICFLASDDASFVTGTVLCVDAGYTA